MKFYFSVRVGVSIQGRSVSLIMMMRVLNLINYVQFETVLFPFQIYEFVKLIEESEADDDALEELDAAPGDMAGGN